MLVLTDIAVLTALIEPVVRAAGFDLVRVQLTGGTSAPTLQVMAEDPATGQLGIDACAAISRALSDVLDAADPIDSEYQLEVSSPGIDRPLTRPADWTRWAGHDVRVKLTAPLDGRKHIYGVVAGLAASGDAAVIEVVKAGALTVPFERIAGAKLVLTNRLINATRPAGMADLGDAIDTDAYDEIIEEPATANDNEDED